MVNSGILGPNAVVAVHWCLPPTAALYYVISTCTTLALGHRQRDGGRVLRRVNLCLVGIICIVYVLPPSSKDL